MVAGIGLENLRLIEVDQQFAMRPEVLARQIAQDGAAGLVPFLYRRRSELRLPMLSIHYRRSALSAGK